MTAIQNVPSLDAAVLLFLVLLFLVFVALMAQGDR
jgi:hypothetical protein